MSVQPNQILQGDCIQRMSDMEAGSIDLVFADPPFNIGYEYDVYEDDRPADDYLAWSNRWIAGVHQVLKPSGTFWLAIGDEYAAELKVAAQQIGFSCRSWVIWYYTFGVNCARGFSRSHTHLFHFVKDPDDFTFNSDNPAVRVPSARQLVYADTRANPKGRLPDNTWIYRPQDGPPGGFAPNHDTWYFARVAGTFKERQGFHGCQMPEQLLGRIIRTCSKPGEVVLDPFGGSGTTMAVAKKLGRQWMGIELSDEYVQHINRRVDRVDVGEDLNGAEDPVLSAPSSSKGKTRYDREPGQSIPLPKLTDDIQKAIVDAFTAVSRGNSAEYVLCDPEIRAEFRRECKGRKIAGSEFFWIRILLGLRKKRGVLPKTTERNRRKPREMDDYSFASEIAMRQLEVDFGLSQDDILCSPDAVVEFDQVAADFAPGHSIADYRWAAIALCKRAETSHKIGMEQYADWQKKKLPAATDLAAIDLDAVQQPGVYILEGRDEQALYVGETKTIATRIGLLEKTQQWQNLGLSSIRCIPDDGADLHGLQAVLVQRLSPLLNLPQPRAAAATVPKPNSTSTSKSKSKPKPKLKSEPKPKLKSEPKSKLKSKPKPKSEPKSKLKSEPKSKLKSEPKSKLKPKLKPKLAETEPQVRRLF